MLESGQACVAREDRFDLWSQRLPDGGSTTVGIHTVVLLPPTSRCTDLRTLSYYCIEQFCGFLLQYCNLPLVPSPSGSLVCTSRPSATVREPVVCRRPRLSSSSSSSEKQVTLPLDGVEARGKSWGAVAALLATAHPDTGSSGFCC